MKFSKDKVELKVGEGADQKVLSQEYDRQIFESVDDVLSQASTPEGLKKVLDCINYGWDLKLRGKIRAQLSAQSAGPDKALEAQIKQVIKMREAFNLPPLSRERIVDLIKEQFLKS